MALKITNRSLQGLILTRLATNLVCSALICFMPAAAMAEDIIGLEEAPTIAPIQMSSGWYLRGDLGTTSKLTTGGASFSTFGSSLTDGTVTDQSYIDDELSFGFGLGYRFNDILRADSTLGFQNGNGSISGSSTNPCDSAPANTNCNLEGSAEFSNFQAMVNAYADLATVSGFTPYIGAGVGVTRVDWHESQMTATCVNGGGSCGATGTINYTNLGATKWRTSWALMAGVSYELSDHLSADLGYRFSRIGSGEQWSASNGASGRDGGFDRHEIRFGLRISP